MSLKKALLALASVLAAGNLYFFGVGAPDPKNLEGYVMQNLPRITREQERATGMRHNGLPIVSLGISFSRWLGVYDPEGNVLLLDEFENTHPVPGLLGKLGVYTHGVFSRGYPVERTLWHELGHYYADRRSERLGHGSWPDFKRFQDCDVVRELTLRRNGMQPTCSEGDRDVLLDFFLLKSIGEGIGTWFEYAGQGRDAFRDSDWPRRLDGISSERFEHLFYEGGYHLVRPILDQYRQRGVDYLITHPPRVSTPRQLPAYRAQALRDLRAASP